MLKLSPKYADACAFIFESARELGGRAYFVGGCVRDALFGATPKDFDIEVYGLPPDPRVPTADLPAMFDRASIAALGMIAGVTLAFLGARR